MHRFSAQNCHDCLVCMHGNPLFQAGASFCRSRLPLRKHVFELHPEASTSLALVVGKQANNHDLSSHRYTFLMGGLIYLLYGSRLGRAGAGCFTRICKHTRG